MVEDVIKRTRFGRCFESVKEDMLKSYDNCEDVILPLRSTKHSSGYDFFAPYDFTIGARETKIIWSDVKAFMQDDEELLIFIRSSVGIKKGVILGNSVGKIDSDYYSNVKNDGNIGIALKNTTGAVMGFKKCDGLMQGTFYNFLVADNCNSDNERVGGLGSTNG